MDEPRFKKLRVWQESMKLAKEIYETTKDFPQNEKYGLSSQLQRAAVSIPSNIAEGTGRGTKKDFSHFLSQARGSLYEIITQLEICFDIGLISTEKMVLFQERCESLSKQINALMISLKEEM
ncbi:MAG: four helix bundle protein [Thermotogae bacterium]|jgi:four helix bundle protein|nr:four helix bundle protein [Thermotogota bacterium]MCL5031906.1 four helix bundle protein [Thermotogota bacterium]